MSGLGSFNLEALQKLKESYAQAMKTAESQEQAGISFGPNNLGVETSPIPSLWSTNLWKYPSGTKEQTSYYSEGLENIDFLSEAELEEIIEDLNTPVNDLEEYEEADVFSFFEEEKDIENMSPEEIRALAKVLLEDYEEEDEIEEDIDLENITAEEFDNLIESILDELGGDEEEEDQEGILELDEIATLILKELKDYEVDILTLSEQDIYALVEGVLFGEEDQDPVSEKLMAIEEMLKQLKEEI